MLTSKAEHDLRQNVLRMFLVNVLHLVTIYYLLSICLHGTRLCLMMFIHAGYEPILRI